MTVLRPGRLTDSPGTGGEVMEVVAGSTPIEQALAPDRVISPGARG